MAKSIWKLGERMTRLEKKKLRKLMPHPNRGRRLYQWKVEGERIGLALVNAAATGKVDWSDIVDKPEPVSPTLDSTEADDETYALPAYEKDDGPLTPEQLERLYKNTTARPGEPITQAAIDAVHNSILAKSQRLELPPGTDLSDLYLE